METKTITPRQCNELANAIKSTYPHVGRELGYKAALAAEEHRNVTLTKEHHLAAWATYTGSGVGKS